MAVTSLDCILKDVGRVRDSSLCNNFVELFSQIN
jgi:hypothetical protein